MPRVAPLGVMMLAVVAACCCLVVVVSASASSSAPRVVPSVVFNPHGKAHAVSRSSFHTDQGRVMDMTHAYPGQGESHTLNGLKPRDVPLEDGRHLWEPEIYAQVSGLLKTNVGTTERLPSLRDAANAVPEQVKLSVTARPSEVVVNWLTWNVSSSPSVRYGTSSGSYGFSAAASTITFVDPNSLHLVRYIHNALLTSLPSSTELFYVVGDTLLNVWSEEMTMFTQPIGPVQSLAVFGDMGVVNSQSMQQLTEEVTANTVQLVLHLGDYAYNMDELEGFTGDVFLEQMSNMTSRVPYMGCPGNHEQAFNFSHYANKFSMYNYVADPSGPADNTWYYSWNFVSGGSKVHVITIDSELYYWDYFKATAQQKADFPRMIENQWNWIVDDLIKAYDSGEYDWIIAYSHRPMYCSNVDDLPDCSTDAETLRKGVPTGPNGELQWGIESALSVRPIDMYFSAHEHSYERTMPVHNGTIDYACQVSPNMYVDPLYPVHIITGSGGCREFFDYYDEVFYGPWSVVRSSTYGYGHLTVHNSTHLFWEQLLDEGRGGTDPLWIVKKSRAERDAAEKAQTKTVDTPRDGAIALE